MIEEILLSTIRLSIPLLMAALGGMLSERSGVANIALEGFLLVSAFLAALFAHYLGNPWLATLVAVILTGVIGLMFAAVSIYGRADQIVIGMAFNLLLAGSIPVICKSLFGASGSTPSLPIENRIDSPNLFLFSALSLFLLVTWMYKKTRFGLRSIAAGENPLALISVGVTPTWIQIKAVVLGAMITALGGTFLSLCLGSGYIRNMSAGRGYIALAALIFGGWRPVPTMLACFFFGLTDALQIQIQGQSFFGISIPSQFIQILPFLAALIFVAFFSKGARAPKAINVRY